jgi:hypothetical protein
LRFLFYPHATLITRGTAKIKLHTESAAKGTQTAVCSGLNVNQRPPTRFLLTLNPGCPRKKYFYFFWGFFFVVSEISFIFVTGYERSAF